MSYSCSQSIVRVCYSYTEWVFITSQFQVHTMPTTAITRMWLLRTKTRRPRLCALTVLCKHYGEQLLPKQAHERMALGAVNKFVTDYWMFACARIFFRSNREPNRSCRTAFGDDLPSSHHCCRLTPNLSTLFGTDLWCFDDGNGNSDVGWPHARTTQRTAECQCTSCRA